MLPASACVIPRLKSTNGWSGLFRQIQFEKSEVAIELALPTFRRVVGSGVHDEDVGPGHFALGLANGAQDLLVDVELETQVGTVAEDLYVIDDGDVGLVILAAGRTANLAGFFDVTASPPSRGSCVVDVMWHASLRTVVLDSLLAARPKNAVLRQAAFCLRRDFIFGVRDGIIGFRSGVSRREAPAWLGKPKRLSDGRWAFSLPPAGTSLRTRLSYRAARRALRRNCPVRSWRVRSPRPSCFLAK